MCVPAVCKGAQLSDIPDASGHLSASLACKVILEPVSRTGDIQLCIAVTFTLSCPQMELLDTAGAQRCLKGMRIVMLGDSTMTETMHDLILLLSGTGSRPEEVASIVYNSTR